MTLAGSSHSGLMSYLPEGSWRTKQDLTNVLRLETACTGVETKVAMAIATGTRRLFIKKSRFIFV